MLHVDEELWAADLLRHTRAIGWAAVRYIRAQIHEGAGHAPSLLEDGAVAVIPTVVIVGGPLDPVATDSEPLVEHLKTAGAKVVFRAHPLLIHGFANMTHVSATIRTAVAEVGELIGRLAR